MCKDIRIIMFTGYSSGCFIHRQRRRRNAPDLIGRHGPEPMACPSTITAAARPCPPATNSATCSADVRVVGRLLFGNAEVANRHLGWSGSLEVVCFLQSGSRRGRPPMATLVRGARL